MRILMEGYVTNITIICTFPVGNLAKNSGDLLSTPIWNCGSLTSIPAYLATINPLLDLAELG